MPQVIRHCIAFAPLALALLDMLLADGELHVSAASDDDGALVVEVM
jgi:hypothetical protein